MPDKEPRPTAQIIPFPISKTRPPLQVEVMRKNIEDSKTEVIEYFVEQLNLEIFRLMSEHGYNIVSDKDFVFLSITLKAILLRYECIFDPLQDFIDDMLKTDDEIEAEENSTSPEE